MKFCLFAITALSSLPGILGRLEGGEYDMETELDGKQPEKKPQHLVGGYIEPVDYSEAWDDADDNSDDLEFLDALVTKAEEYGIQIDEFIIDMDNEDDEVQAESTLEDLMGKKKKKKNYNNKTQKGYIKVVNKAPKKGTCQTPVWVGIHDGSFDTYDRDAKLPKFMEALVEDGNNAPVTAEFARTKGAVWDGTVGDGPICPGETAKIPFEIDLLPDTVHYFSYASMILPSNDAFVSNGNPKAHRVFSAEGKFFPVLVESTGDMALDGGTEVNDEIPENTAFFGQTVPDTGVDENGVVILHPGFNKKGSGGILDDPEFAKADFTKKGYDFMEISVYLKKPKVACKKICNKYGKCKKKCFKKSS